MQDVHRNAFLALLRTRGHDGVYVTTDGVEHRLRAVRGQTPFRIEADGNRGGTITRSTDWLFDIWGFRESVGRWPADGDKFRVKVAGQSVEITTEYRVTKFNNEPVYRTDPGLAHVRVHMEEYATL